MNASIQAHTSEISARPHACAACGRQFVVVGIGRSTKPRCLCGAALAESGLAGGVYELRRAPRAAHAAQASHGKAASKREPTAEPTMPKEPDLGYGESHGYGPSHGGPSGPGDAPATEITMPKATPEKPASKHRSAS